MTWRRIFLFSLVALLVFFYAGALTPVGKDDANKIMEETKRIVQEKSVTAIFLNNARLTLLFLVPGLGLFLAPYAVHRTGLAFAASTVVSGVPLPVLIAVVTILPFFWLEFTAYAASLTQSMHLLASPFRHRVRQELKRTVYVILVTIALLLVGAFIEAAII